MAARAKKRSVQKSGPDGSLMAIVIIAMLTQVLIAVPVLLLMAAAT